MSLACICLPPKKFLQLSANVRIIVADRKFKPGRVCNRENPAQDVPTNLPDRIMSKQHVILLQEMFQTFLLQQTEQKKALKARKNGSYGALIF
jgi:hypothetical protein